MVSAVRLSAERKDVVEPSMYFLVRAHPLSPRLNAEKWWKNGHLWLGGPAFSRILRKAGEPISLLP